MQFIICANIDSDFLKVAEYKGQKVTISGQISQDVIKKEGTSRLSLNTISINYSINAKKSQIYVMLDDLPTDLVRSDRVTLSGELLDGFGQYQSFLYKPQLISYGKPSPPDLAQEIRAKFSNALREIMPEQSNLALGYLVGEKGGMSEEFTNNLKRIGMTHAVVASGFHLSVLIEFAKKYLKKLSRLCALLGSLLFLLLFVAIAGFSPSLARAGIITSLSLLAWYFGRRLHPGRIIVYAMALTLLIDPAYISNLAWQLSFLSYVGILVLAPIFTSYLYGDKTPGAIASSIIQSASAQLLCLPVLVLSYGEFSILGILANLLISPTIPLAMATSLIAGLASLLKFAPILALPAKIVLSIHMTIVDRLAKIPWAVMTIENSPQLALLIYPIIFILAYVIKRHADFSFRPRPKLEKTEKNGKIYAC